MRARLGVAIAAHFDPEVLLIDDVLSVGDAAFQDRCTIRMRQIREAGVPIVFVSHNLPAMVELCARAIVMDHGQIRFEGDPAAAVAQYLHASSAAPVERRRPRTDIWIHRVQLLDSQSQATTMFHPEPATIRVDYETGRPIEGQHSAIDIHRAEGLYCAGINTMMDSHDVGRVHGRGVVDLVVCSLSLLPGATSCQRASSVRRRPPPPRPSRQGISAFFDGIGPP
jgi:ABC-type glutathione transport system ATPase component